MALHAFVAMPFGVKEGVDFNSVYADYIRPALEAAGFEVFRADEELRAGSIHRDMFQELLLADLVVADLSIDNPNVWYELGVRHALRARGVVQVQCKRDYMPFDVYGQRTLRYHVTDEGVPDPARLDADRDALTRSAVETRDAWRGLKVSPVYDLLDYLQEPDWKSLRVGTALQFWEAQEEWGRRIELARRRDRPGDILVLADEAPTRMLRLEAHRTAGRALTELDQFRLACDQYERALRLDPGDLESRRQKGQLLSRLRDLDEAELWLEGVVRDHPEDSETWAMLGRLAKHEWLQAWRTDTGNPGQMRADAASEEALLRQAIDRYRTGFSKDPRHYYSGINAVTLTHLLEHLTGEEEDPEERRAMEGGVQWAVQCALAVNADDYWARFTEGELNLLIRGRKLVERAYRAAVAAADRNRFALNSARDQLLILRDLDYRTDLVQVALAIVERALSQARAPDQREEPRQVFLFSGHRCDEPERPEPRFPSDPERERRAREAIAAQLDELDAGPEDLAVGGGACGGDLLFADECLRRGMHLDLRLPFAEPLFLHTSVTYAGDHWRDLYYQVARHDNTRLWVMPEELGPDPAGINRFSRNNLWRLYTALAWGVEKVRFICLWNGRTGDGPGGTHHMLETVRRFAGRVYIIDIHKLWQGLE